MIFHSRPRDDFDSRGKSYGAQGTEETSKDEVTRLEETFAKLRSATGVSRTEDVLNRFLGQRATKDNLQKMRVATEQEKMKLEKQRQRLVDEMETRKFSETRNAEQWVSSSTSLCILFVEDILCLVSACADLRTSQKRGRDGKTELSDRRATIAPIKGRYRETKSGRSAARNNYDVMECVQQISSE